MTLTISSLTPLSEARPLYHTYDDKEGFDYTTFAVDCPQTISTTGTFAPDFASGPANAPFFNIAYLRPARPVTWQLTSINKPLRGPCADCLRSLNRGGKWRRLVPASPPSAWPWIFLTTLPLKHGRRLTSGGAGFSPPSGMGGQSGGRNGLSVFPLILQGLSGPFLPECRKTF